MSEKIYMHGIGRLYNYETNEQLSALSTICKSGSLLSLREQGKTKSYNFSGLDYVCFGDYEKRFVYNDRLLEIEHPNSFANKLLALLVVKPEVPEKYNAYNKYICRVLSLVFPKENIDAIEPEILDICSRSEEGLKLLHSLGLSTDKRYSDLPDEVQVRNKVSLDKMSAVAFPTMPFLDRINLRKNKYQVLKNEIVQVKAVLDEYGYSVPIIDNDSLEELTDECVKDFALSHKNKLTNYL